MEKLDFFDKNVAFEHHLIEVRDPFLRRLIAQ